MGLLIKWNDPNLAEEGHNLYKSTSPMDPLNLPAPLVSLGPDVEEYEDPDVVEGSTYYYRVGAFINGGTVESVSDELVAVADETIAPYMETFETGIPTDFGFGDGDGVTPTITYDATNKALRIAGPSPEQYFYDVTSFPALLTGTIEADIFFETDHANRQHAGFLFSSDNGEGNTEGVLRFVSLDGNWVMTQMLAGSFSSTGTPIYERYGGDLIVGQTYKMRMVFENADTYQLFQDGALIMDAFSEHISSVQPGFHVYGATLQINAIRMWPTKEIPLP